MFLPQVHVVPRSQLPACRAQHAHQLKAHFLVQMVAFLVRAHDLAHNRAHALQREQVEQLAVNRAAEPTPAMVGRKIHRKLRRPRIRRAAEQTAAIGIAHRAPIFLAHNVRIRPITLDDALTEFAERGHLSLVGDRGSDIRLVDFQQSLGIVRRSKAECMHGFVHFTAFYASSSIFMHS